MGACVFLFSHAAAPAQDAADSLHPAFRDKAVVVDIVARVVERNAEELWNSESSKVTIPGRPVSIKLVGSNVVVVVQFTPFRKDDGKTVLVAQGQVWINTEQSGMTYHTTIQTIPLEYGEKVYFFPLGPKREDGAAQIEIQIELHPFVAPDAPAAPGGEAPAAEQKSEGARSEK